MRITTIIALLTIFLLRCDTNPVGDSSPLFHVPLSDTTRLFEITPQENLRIEPYNDEPKFETRSNRPISIPRLTHRFSRLFNTQRTQLLSSKPNIHSPAETEKLQPTTVFLDFDNDIFTGKDYYYTNGVTIGISAPWLSFIKKSGLFLGLGKEAQNRYGISLTQKMFTSLNPETKSPPIGDHPFSGLLYADFFSTSYLPQKGLILRSGISLGVTGAASLAKNMQKLIHQLEPNGWDFQTGNSFLINYNISIEKEYFRQRIISFSSGLALKAGNLETLSSGFLKLSLDLFPEINNKVDFMVFTTATGSLVLHKASLRGGLWGCSSPHRIPFDELSKTVGELSTGVMLQTGRTAIGFKAVYLSPEFHQGRPHNWGSIQLNYNL